MHLIGVGMGGQPLNPFEIGKGKKKNLPETHRDAEALLADLVRYVRNFYLDGTHDPARQLQPMVVACCNNGDGFAEEEHKQQWSKLCRKFFKEWDVRHYGMVTEAWMAMASPDEVTLGGKAKRNIRMPSEREDRQEVVFVNTADRRDRRYMVALEMIRDHTGQVVDLKELYSANPDDLSSRFSGRFANFLVPETSIYGDREPIHPCDDREFKARHESTLTMLMGIAQQRPTLGEKTDELVARGLKLAGQLSLAWDRLRAIPLAKLQRDHAVYDEYNSLIEQNVLAIITDMMPYFSPETQDLFRRMVAERGTRH